MISVRAIYENGVLRLLDPAPFKDGETVTVRIVSEREQVIQSLAEAGLLVPPAQRLPQMTEMTAKQQHDFMDEIMVSMAGVDSLADAVLDDRAGQI